MLSQEEFFEYVKEHILEYMTNEEGRNVMIKEVKKNNQVSMYGLTIERGLECVPVLYLNRYYEQYQEGEDLGELLCLMGKVYEEALKEDTLEIRLKYFEDFEAAKDRIFFRVINFEKNKEMLETCPFERIGDLAVTYRLLLDQNEHGMTSALVRFADLERWKIEKERLFLEGHENTKKLFPPMISSMEEMLEGKVSFGDECPSMLYVATNQLKINGASVMLYEDFLYQFALKMKENLFIIPSSIHEIILVKESEALGKETMEQMIRDTNQEIVDPEEVLSDRLYYYDKDEDHISVA